MMHISTLSVMCSVEGFKEIQDSICVAQRRADNSEERVLLFLKMAPGVAFTPELVTNVKACIRKYLSARHVPALVLPCTDVPVRYVHPKCLLYLIY